MAAIDFDDCGYGFFVYDLVIPYMSAECQLGEKKKHVLPEYKKALLEGYQTKRKWDRYDEAIFSHLAHARKLFMLGWINSRSDNPKYKKYLKCAVEKTLADLKKSY